MDAVQENDKLGYIGEIPVRNLWLLMLYASQLFRQINDLQKREVEDNPDDILPSMRADTVLDHIASGRRIIIDTKFTSILKSGNYRTQTLASGHIYQIYAYLRSQEGLGDPLADTASGILLHPAVNCSVDESVDIQGHNIRFATVNLDATPREIRHRLLKLIDPTLV